MGFVSVRRRVGHDLPAPARLPDAARLGAGPAILGLIEGVAESTASLTKVASGWWSDRIRHRKRLVVLGYIARAVVRPLVGLAQSWIQVLAIRFADRVGKGIRTAPRDALLAALAPPEKPRPRLRPAARHGQRRGSVAGPILAALLLKFVVPRGADGLPPRARAGPRRRGAADWRVPDAPAAVPRFTSARERRSRPTRSSPRALLDRDRASSSSSPSPTRRMPSCSCARGTRACRSGRSRCSGPSSTA